MVKYFVGAVALVMLVSFSASMATYVFSGVLMFVGLVVLTESIGLLKWLFRRTGNLIDMLIFGVSIYAMSSYGVTVTIALSVAGLLFSVYYKPILKAGKEVNNG